MVGTTLFQLAGAALFLFCLDRRMAVVILLIMPLALLCSKLYMKRMRRLTREIRATDSRVQSHLQENLQHRTLISVLECTPVAADTMSSLQSGLKRLVMRRNSFSIFSSIMVQAGFALGYVTAFAWGIYGLDTGTVTFGTLAAFLQLVAQVQRPVVELARQVPVFIGCTDFRGEDRRAQLHAAGGTGRACHPGWQGWCPCGECYFYLSRRQT